MSQAACRNGKGQMSETEPPEESSTRDLREDAADEEPAVPRARGKRARRPRRRKLSVILTEIAEDTALERVSVEDLLRKMHGRAIGALMLIFALPNVLPAPPGTSGVLGLPLIYLTWQMMLGRLPWLPGFIARRSMTRGDFAALVQRVAPVLARAERLLQPRLPIMVSSGAERAIGAVCLVLSLILLLPVPFGNMLPALAICIFALGVLERDGVWVIAGLVVTGLAVTIVAGVIYALAQAALFVILRTFT